MISASHSTGRTCAQAPLTCERGFLRPCIVPAKLSYPRQRNVDISCSAQSVSGDLRQGVSGNKRDRLHVIALISEAVSVNVRIQPSSPDVCEMLFSSVAIPPKYQ